MSFSGTAGPIFLSHAGADTQAARELAKILRNNHLDVCLDADNLQPGDRWMIWMQESINRASAMLVYIGQFGVKNWFDREVGLGLARNTKDPKAFRLIPVLGKGAKISSLPSFLAQHQCTDLSDMQRSPEQILRLIEVLRTSANDRAISDSYWLNNSPFQGLQEFKTEYGWLFCGRDQNIEEVVARLERANVLAIVGNSGTGKSSLIRAGLVPALQRGRFVYQNEFVKSWQIAILRPSQTPFDHLAESLPRQLRPDLDPAMTDEYITRLKTTLPQDRNALRTAIAALKKDMENNIHTLLVVDQFEELFVNVENFETRNRYIDLLMTATHQRGVHLVLSLRADFYSHCVDEHEELRRCLETNLYNFPRMTPEQLRESIEMRLALTAARAEDGLIDTLLSDVGDEPGNLPLLEHALYQLWTSSGQSNSLTNQAYVGIGRLRGALSRHADNVCERFQHRSEQLLLQRIFLELVEVGEGTQDTRRRVLKNDLVSLGSSSQITQMLDHLASSRLIQTGKEGEKDFVEISHEALIREWRKLREWIEQNREDLRLERRLKESAHEWEKEKRNRASLLQGIRLAQAVEWLKRHPNAGGLLREFVETSRTSCEQAELAQQQAQERMRRSAIRFRWLSYSLGILLAAFVLLAILLWRVSAKENQEKHNAQTAFARSAVQDGIKLFDESRPDQAAAYFARALRAAPDSVAATSWLSYLMLYQDWWLPDSPLQQHDVNSAAFSPDGLRIATASNDHTVRLWETDTGDPIGPQMLHPEPVFSVAFSPDGHRIITASDSSVRIWDATTGRPLGTPMQHLEPVLSVAFSPDGHRIVTASKDGTIGLWNAQNGQSTDGIMLPREPVRSAAFSPDGRHILTASNDGKAKVWEARTGKLIIATTALRSLFSAAYSFDGRLIITASGDGTARVWLADSGKSAGAVLQHESSVRSASFSPKGLRIITVSDDHIARVWDAEVSRPARTVMQHEGPLVSATFSRDGRRIVTASNDGAVRIWDAETGKRVSAIRQSGPVFSAAFSPDGRLIVTLSEVPHNQRGEDARFDSGKSQVLRGNPGDDTGLDRIESNGVAYLWDVNTGKQVGSAMEHQKPVLSAGFSSDGHRIVTASADDTARLWDVETGKPVGTSMEHRGLVRSATFSPDGRYIVTASDDFSARVWEAESGKPVGAPMQHQGRVLSAAFSPDGHRIVTASEDKTARVWETETGKPLGAPLHHQSSVSSAAFSPDGHRIITASEDHTAVVWPVLLMCCTSQEEANQLAGLAEAISGNEVSDKGSLSPVVNRQDLFRQLRHQSEIRDAGELTLNWISKHFKLPESAARRSNQ